MKSSSVSERVFHNVIGEEIHEVDGQHGKMLIKRISHSAWEYTGVQWCPECHIEIIRKEGYFECPQCKYSITDEEAECGDGYPTLESTYEDDYEEYYE